MNAFEQLGPLPDEEDLPESPEQTARKLLEENMNEEGRLGRALTALEALEDKITTGGIYLPGEHAGEEDVQGLALRSLGILKHILEDRHDVVKAQGIKRLKDLNSLSE